MWRCVDCEAEFEEAAAYIEKHGWESPPYEKWQCCPFCGSQDLEQLHLCSLCGESKPYHKMSDSDDAVCETCFIFTCQSWQKIKERVAADLLTQEEIRLLKEHDAF